MEIDPLGDSTLIIRVSDSYESNPDEASSAVLDALHRLESARIPGVVEFAPAYATIAAFFDPLQAIKAGAPATDVFSWLEARIRTVLERARSRTAKSPPSRRIDIPVCYDADFGLDLEEVARHANRALEEVIELHSAGEYRVSCLGFTPGFPFLRGLALELATPRRDTPRKGVSAGSVAIGGRQTGIYPLRSPGGWNIIGRTPLRLFDFKRESPALLQVGDRVRFFAVTRETFDELNA